MTSKVYFPDSLAARTLYIFLCVGLLGHFFNPREFKMYGQYIIDTCMVVPSNLMM